MTEPDVLKFGIDVVAGILPDAPDAQWSRRFTIGAREWEAAGAEGQSQLLAEFNGRAQGYAGWLMLLPNLVNWVRVDWIMT